MHTNAYDFVVRPAVETENPETRGGALCALREIAGEGFRLTAVQPSDASRLEVLAEDPDFKKWLPWIRGGFAAETAKVFASEYSAHAWASGEPVWAIRVDAELAGVIDLRNRGDGVWEVGFWLHPDHRGRGLMTRANQLVAKAAFEDLGARRLLHFARVGNFPSLQVARRLGFHVEGVRRKYAGGIIQRQWQSALLREDWVDGQKTLPSRGTHQDELAAVLSEVCAAAVDLGLDLKPTSDRWKAAELGETCH